MKSMGPIIAIRPHFHTIFSASMRDLYCKIPYARLKALFPMTQDSINRSCLVLFLLTLVLTIQRRFWQGERRLPQISHCEACTSTNVRLRET